MSPAQLLFGRALADCLPVNPSLYQLHPYWSKQTDINKSNRHARLRKTVERYNFGTSELRKLKVGQDVVVQNTTTRRWDRLGSVLKVFPFRKYLIRMNDNGNTTFRNRRFLKPYKAEETMRSKNTAEIFLPGPIVRRDSADACPQSGAGSDGPTNEPEQSSIPTSAPPLSLPTRPQLSARDLSQPKVPLARRRLLPHNAPGLTETPVVLT